MATELKQRFYDLLRKHFETGVPWKDMSFTEEQKRRVEVCLDTYKRFETDPYIDLNQYLRNRWNRTYSEIKNDIKVIEYISSFYSTGQRHISTMKVRHAADTLMRNGANTGNMKALYDGASLLTKIDRLDQPETPDELGDELIKMPVVIISDVQKKFPNKKSHTEEEMDCIRKKWGVRKDPWQELVEDKNGVYVPSEYPEESEGSGERDSSAQLEE